MSMRIGGEERFIAAEDAGLYRDALGAVPPGGLPEAFVEPVEEPLERLVRRYARTHGPFTTADLAPRYGIDPGAVLRELEGGGGLVRGELRPGGREREWCDPDVLRRLRRASLARCARRSRPSSRSARALPAGVAGHRRRPSWRSGDRPPARGPRAAAGARAHSETWENDVLPRRAGRWSPTWLDQLCSGGELVWIGAGALGRSSGGSPSTSAMTCTGSARPRTGASRPPAPPRRDPRAARDRRRVLVGPARGSRRDRDRRAAGGPLGPRLGGRGD